MNWIQLNKDYPLAFAYMMANFKCLYTKKKWPTLTSAELVNPSRKETVPIIVKHPLKRDLYDFFDEIEIFVTIDFYDNMFPIKINGVYINVHASRYPSETEAFTKAFQMLEKRLRKQAELPVI